MMIKSAQALAFLALSIPSSSTISFVSLLRPAVSKRTIGKPLISIAVLIISLVVPGTEVTIAVCVLPENIFF